MSTISLTGVADALSKHTDEGTESKGIKAHFAMDDSGVLNLANVELVFEKTVVAAEEEEGTFSKLGSTISKLFAGLCYLLPRKWSYFIYLTSLFLRSFVYIFTLFPNFECSCGIFVHYSLPYRPEV